MLQTKGSGSLGTKGRIEESSNGPTIRIHANTINKKPMFMQTKKVNELVN